MGDSEEYKDLNRGDGVCRHYDDSTHKCLIYKERPLRCNVDEYYKAILSDKMPLKDYHRMNRMACDELKRKYLK